MLVKYPVVHTVLRDLFIMKKDIRLEFSVCDKTKLIIYTY